MALFCCKITFNFSNRPSLAVANVRRRPQRSPPQCDALPARMALPADGANVAEGKESWKGIPREKCHTGTDARWTRNGGASFLGCKLRGEVDKRSKLVKGCAAMAAPCKALKRQKTSLTEATKA